MKKIKIQNFPFTAILGQDDMKLALILNVIDPKIGGVLLTGQQGTGKSTAARSLVALLPEIEVYEGCPFQCNLEDPEKLCDYCKEKGEKKPEKTIKKPISFVNLPLGATEEMVIGSLDIERIIKEGKREFQPGLLAKANRGIMYIDEINLLPDHLVDILLDASASGINHIEREGISITHLSSFILVGSMNPEEGELRPQISDRLGLEIGIKAPIDPSIRAEITNRVIEFQDDPQKFIENYKLLQIKLKENIIFAKKNLSSIKISPKIYNFASELVIKFGLISQRTEITYLHCARAHAAFRNSTKIEKEDLKQALNLVFKYKLAHINPELNNDYLGTTFEELWHKIPKSFEDPTLYKGTDKEMMNTFKSSPDLEEKYRENPLNKENEDLPEVDDKDRKSQDRYSNFDSDEDFSHGFKASSKKTNVKKRIIDPDNLLFYRTEKPINLDVSPIFRYLKKKQKIVNYTGRGTRVRLNTKSKGRYIYAQKPRGKPHSIAFDASIKSHFINNTKAIQTVLQERSYNSNLAVNLNIDDIQEKINVVKAPISLYFIVDASASMRRTLDQTIKIIQSVHAEGYKKKDKISVISFQGKESTILQRPAVSFSVGLTELKNLEATSYTPLASALKKTLTMIQQEKIKGFNLPIIIILSDLGANISLKYPGLNATSSHEFQIISDELDEIANNIGKKQIMVIIMKPKKSWATRYLGIDQFSVERIQKSFLKNAAKIFEFDTYSPDTTIMTLKEIIEKGTENI
ncbi:ATP-binding protein [Promethearchaeum syntrophicum]|uniref:ATP-binding protein n=1 Tax=Promethearchaeum syntrophicum TaxID=2594042 RepID=A0A5B9DF59_9ARCH|nr:ATP-binding protein [Candidatus Prometheoarchaeum syntrophicum]QEE17661.1 Magnesium chelatase, subunit ChlI [Candidatus Prometheoarchaeum syntrophicum]